MKVWIIIFSIFVCTDISAQKKDSLIPSLNGGDILMVIPIEQELPDSCQLIGKINVGDNGYNRGCDYPSILKFAEQITLKANGNILKINTIKLPDHFCKCYRLYGTIFHRKNLGRVYRDKSDDSIAKYKFGDTAKYAILYVFRPYDTKGVLIGYNVHMGDSVICRAKNNSVYEIKLKKEGMVKISSQTESSSSVVIDVKYKHVYYLECSIGLGVLIGEPYLELLDKFEGEKEYQKVKKSIESEAQSKSLGIDNN